MSRFEALRSWKPACRVFLLVLAVAVLLGACTEREKPQEETSPRLGSYSKATGDHTRLPARELDARTLQIMASLLAGVEPPANLDADDSDVVPLAASGERAKADLPAGDPPKVNSAWDLHRAEMEKVWTRIDPRLQAMSHWSRDELSRLPGAEAPVFYPFGGPDLFAVFNLFPHASSFILVGLEAPGRLPMPEEAKGAGLAEDLARLRQPFESMAQSGYFVRTQIDEQLSGGHFDGILPILLIALVRAGQMPEAVQYVRLDQSGQLVGLEDPAASAGAVRILFRPAAGPGKVRSVFYYAQDLSNDGVFPDSGFYHMVEKLGTVNSFIKSGEYLLHTDPFSNLRKLMLDRSQVVLQDDSGVPLRFFTSDRWTVDLYGHYEDVLAAYKPWFQQDLAAAYQRKDKILPLPFAAGYQTAVSGGCLILSNRKASQGAQQRREIGS